MMGRRRWAEDARRDSDWATVEYEAGSIRMSRHGPSWEWYRTMSTMGPAWAEEMAAAAWRDGRQLRQLRPWRRHRHHHGPLLPLAIIFAIFALSHGAFFIFPLMMVVAVVVVGSVMRAVVREMRVCCEPRDGTLPRPAEHAFSAISPVGGALSANEYRQQLLDVLKERYVRGEITVGEFEQRAGQIVREPSARHLG